MSDIHELIERSSLGTPHAKAMRASVSDEDAQHVVALSVAYGQFLDLGFTDEQAWALARADMQVVGWVPLGWAYLPFDEHLARIGGDR